MVAKIEEFDIWDVKADVFDVPVRPFSTASSKR
jgi:hypothetical protein